MVLTELVHLFDSSTKSTIGYVFIVLLTDHRHLIVQYIFLYIWDIAATGESISGRRFYALFKYVLHYPQGNERTGDIQSSWVDVTTAAGPILLRLGCATKMAVFWNYFQDFIGAQKIEDLPKSKFFLQKYLKYKVDSFWRKNFLGVRCTLRIKLEIIISNDVSMTHSSFSNS